MIKMGIDKPTKYRIVICLKFRKIFINFQGDTPPYGVV